MYTPKFNQVSDRAILIEAMQAYSFAILFGPLDSAQPPEVHHATHLPLVVKDEGPHGIIEGHFAKANPTGNLSLITKPLSSSPAPTAMSARRSMPRSCPSPPGTTSPSTPTEPWSSSKTIPGKGARARWPYPGQRTRLRRAWRSLPDGFRRTMLAGIVGFRIPITRIEGKFKISQNRPEIDRRAVHAAHSAGSPDQQH